MPIPVPSLIPKYSSHPQFRLADANQRTLVIVPVRVLAFPITKASKSAGKASGMIKFLTASIAAKIVAASLLSSLIAGAICALTEPVVADNAAVIATSVDRSNKSDRLRIVQRPEHYSSSANKAISSRHSLPGCEPAFSPFADPGLPNLLNYCQT